MRKVFEFVLLFAFIVLLFTSCLPKLDEDYEMLHYYHGDIEIFIPCENSLTDNYFEISNDCLGFTSFQVDTFVISSNSSGYWYVDFESYESNLQIHMYFEKSILFEDGIYLFNTFPEDDTWSDTIREVNISVTYGQETDDYQMFYSNLDADIYVEYVLDSTIITFCEVPFCNYQSLESEFNLSGRLVIFE